MILPGVCCVRSFAALSIWPTSHRRIKRHQRNGGRDVQVDTEIALVPIHLRAKSDEWHCPSVTRPVLPSPSFTQRVFGGGRNQGRAVFGRWPNGGLD